MSQQQPIIDPQVIRQRLWLEELVSDCERPGFFGELRVLWEDGKIVFVDYHKKLKPPKS